MGIYVVTWLKDKDKGGGGGSSASAVKKDEYVDLLGDGRNRNIFDPDPDHDPDHDPNIPEEVKKALRTALIGGLTNAAADVIAEYLGFKRTKDSPFKDSHGKHTFKNGKKFISADRDRHSGGIWKMIFKNQRSTMNWNLTKIIGK